MNWDQNLISPPIHTIQCMQKCVVRQLMTIVHFVEKLNSSKRQE